MSNIMKKITVGNPLFNFGLFDELEEYDKIEKPEELAAFYHRMLDMSEDRPLLNQAVHAMISYSTGVNINANMLLL